MRRKLTSLSLVAFLGLGGLAMAQVTGVVKDENGFPEIEAEIIVKGTDKVSYTDENGKYSIDAKVGDVIIINGVEVVVTSSVVNYASAKKDDVFLDEVVVMGYGITATKPKSNAAVVTIGADVLENRPNASLLSSLQGTAPGLAINSASGSPGSGKINAQIRGVNSLNASTDPLYVIDGVATSGTQFRNLNPEDIDNISVLKDAQATSIYGNRGANGVVIISTKAGKFNSGLQIDYSGLSTVSYLPKTKYDMANTRDFLTIQRGIGYNNLTDAQISEAAKVNTNWNKEFFQVGFNQQHSLGLRFGGENVSVYSSFGYLESEGTVKGTDFKRFTFRNNITGRSKDNRFTYNAQVALGYSRRNQLDQETNSGVNNNTIQNPLLGSLQALPYLEPYRYANGREMYNDVKGNYQPTWILQDIINGGIKNQFTETSIFASVNARYQLTDFLSVGNRIGIDYKQHVRDFARTPNGYLSVLVAANAGAEYGGFEQIQNTQDATINNVFDISFNKSFGESTLTANAFLEYTKAHYQYALTRQDGLNPLNWELGSGTGWVSFNPSTPNLYRPQVGAQKINAGTLAYFATVDYDYSSKYGVAATIRRDGSYRFSKENRWETFWSVSARWNIDQEEFLQGSNLRMLKLRGSYGTTGNQNLLPGADNLNPLLTGANIYKQLYSASTGYMGNQGFSLATLANSNIKWEVVKQGNIGIDFDYAGIVTGSIDVYQKTTDRMFNGINVSATTGAWTVRGNNGTMQNTGIEGLLRFNLLNKKDFKLSVFVNSAYNKNKIKAMDTEDLTGTVVNAVGGPALQYHMYKFVGVNRETGEQQFLDKDGNVSENVTAADRVLTGKSVYAPWTGGFGFNASYKGFFFDTLFSFQQGGWSNDTMYNWLTRPSYAVDSNISSHLLNAWTPTNTETNIPSLRASNLGLEGNSDRFLTRTDFIRLKNVTLGYSLTNKDLGSLPIKSLRLFLTGENLLTWTNWIGYDPEPLQTSTLSVYPNPKSVSIGVNIGF